MAPDLAQSGDIGVGDSATVRPNRHAALWLFLGLAIFFQLSYLGNQLLIPKQRLGVLQLTVHKMLTNDIATFMVLFGVYFVNFYALMFVIYPRSGSESLGRFVGGGPAFQFDTVIDSLQAMVQLAFVGEPVTISTDPDDYEALFLWQKVWPWLVLASSLPHSAFWQEVAVVPPSTVFAGDALPASEAHA